MLKDFFFFLDYPCCALNIKILHNYIFIAVGLNCSENHAIQQNHLRRVFIGLCICDFFLLTSYQVSSENDMEFGFQNILRS